MDSEPPPDRLPWMPSPDDGDGRPPWDQEDADWIVGKTVLVGLTYLAPDGETVTSHVQYHGRIISADRENGIAIERGGVWAGKTMTLPPMTQVFHPADRGEYRLRSTGEVVKDPDIVATWSITAPS